MEKKCSWLPKADCLGGCELGCRLFQLYLEGKPVPDKLLQTVGEKEKKKTK